MNILPIYQSLWDCFKKKNMFYSGFKKENQSGF